ncbi:MAG: fumarylacetoacetate hydrolase family protein [Myxococcota bacterium]|nr:fumarylacetoacetate hydrolase family protein [Myxococcota bacterium]
MQLFATSRGIARACLESEAQLEILDSASSDLAEHFGAGAFEPLRSRPPEGRVAIEDVTFLPPIAQPGRFVIAGLNYRAHCEEVGRPVPERLLFGFTNGAAALGARAPIRIPAAAPEEVDYEGEVAVVIGRTVEGVAAADAWSVVAGLTPINDVSARDVQRGGTLEALARAKGFPTFKPFGPCVATLDEFADPLDIGIRTWVNGELRQSGRTSDMAFPIPQILEAVTARVRLEPGDVVCTGTPGGVAHGGAHPYLVAGDRVEIELEGLPRLSNAVGAGE